MQDSTNIKKYKRLAPIYDVIFGAKIIKTARKKAINKLSFKNGDSVLLVGVGTGEDLNLIPHACEITGIDISDDMLSKARKKIKKDNIVLLNMNAEKTTFIDKSFDYAILNLVLSVVENPQKVMLECLRLVKDDGLILIFDKFVKVPEKISFFRKMFNVLSSAIGTDINRSLEEILFGLPVKRIQDEASILNGNYRIVLLSKG